MTDRPNVLLVNCDDLGYGDLGCYGSRVHRTPHLDRLAAEGMCFTDFYMPASVCSPSRGGMLTGCYPTRIGFGWFDNRWVLLPGHPVGLNPGEITVARLLKDAGYETALIGKWHCGDQPPFLPTAHGFDTFYGLPYSNDMGMQRPAKDFPTPPLPLMRGTEVIQQQPDQSSLTERYVEEAVSFLRRPRRQPFFLYFAHMYVHTPLFVPDRFCRHSTDGAYGAAVACIDWAMGALLHELKERGLAENTLVIFTSDNGSARFECNAPLRGTKGTTWEGGMRLPCIMRWPGKIQAATSCSAITTAMDFFPTVATLAGAPLPTDRIIDGKDISHLLLNGGNGESPHAAFFYYMCNCLEAVRCGNWKLHVGKKFGGEYREIRELYDLSADPGEHRNLYAGHPEVVKELDALLETCRQDLGDEATGVTGTHVRPIGRVPKGETLTNFDPQHPYFCDEYDLESVDG